MYFEFSKVRSLNQLKKLHSTIHWERRLGTQKQAIDYCHKEGHNIVEWGEKQVRWCHNGQHPML